MKREEEPRRKLRRIRPAPPGEAIYGGLYHTGIKTLLLPPGMAVQVPLHGSMPTAGMQAVPPHSLAAPAGGVYEAFFSLRGMLLSPATLTLMLSRNGEALPDAAAMETVRPCETQQLHGALLLRAEAGDLFTLRVACSTETKLILPAQTSARLMMKKL